MGRRGKLRGRSPAGPRKKKSASGGRKSGGPQKRDSEAVKLKGVFEGHSRGYGFVRPDKEGAEDVFIPPKYVGDALHGDKVLVNFHAQGRDGRSYGEIVKVIERSAVPVVGLFNGQTVIPRDPRFSAWIKVRTADAGNALPGDMVMAEISKVGSRGVYGKIIEVIGDSDDPGIESRIVLRSHGFEEDFPADAVMEAENAPSKVTPRDLKNREDLRGILTVTIDPESARDFDDAVSIQRTQKGYRLWVSIADVSHYVRPQSAIDREAYERATSVYFPDRAIHMLPTELSAGICSLKPEVDRLAMTAEMEFDAKGKRQSARFYASVIKSDCRLSYDRVEEMERDSDLRSGYPEIWPAIELMRELAGLRTDIRRQRGSVDLDVPEPQIVLDEDGQVLDIKRSEQTWSHRLIEEFMLVANEAVAEYMAESESPMVYRVHEPPGAAAVLALADMLAPLGFQLLEKGADPENIKPRDFQRVIEQARGAAYEPMVKVLCLRAMMQAKYSADLIGHFGLAAHTYCHFTSPIRRYPDLMVHRLLKQLTGFEKEAKEPAPELLPRAAAHCSERERAAEDAEREMVDLYRVRWMAGHLGEEFEGMVSGVTPYGLFVELFAAYVEGLVPIEGFSGQVEFDPETLVLRDVDANLEFRIGDRVMVKARAVDFDQRKISFDLMLKPA